MPTTLTRQITLYTFDELTEHAKDRARDWYRQISAGDPADLEYEIDSIVEDARILGIEPSTRTVSLYGGGTRQEPAIWYSVSYSQGDGLTFSGRYSYAAGAIEKFRAKYGQSKTLDDLIDLARRFQVIQRRYFYRLSCSFVGNDQYYSVRMEWAEVTDHRLGNGRDVSANTEEELRDLIAEFHQIAYYRLRDEVEYQDSNETVDENIRANEYTFDADGQRID